MNNLEYSKFNNYYISRNNKEKIEKFISESKIYNKEFEQLINISKSLDSFQESLKNQKLINEELRKRNNELVLKFNQKDK